MHEQITSEIFQVGGPFLTSANDAASYLIKIGDRGALVDAGCGTDPTRLLDNIGSCGLAPEQVEYLLITHCHIDHVGGADAFRNMTGCTIVAHERDAVFLESGDDGATAAEWYGLTLDPFAIDRKLTEAEETIMLGDREITALHVPGHSPGSVVYLMESDGYRVVFAQDAHGPLHPVLKSDQADYIASLRRLLGLEADILCEGHFGIYKGKDEVRKFIVSFLDA